MTSLATEFTKKKWNYKQLRRDGDVALYIKEQPAADGNKIVSSYEVIIVQHATADWYGVQKGAESYPSAEMWGMKAWTPHNEEEANKYFEFLVELQKSEDGLKNVPSSIREWNRQRRNPNEHK